MLVNRFADTQRDPMGASHLPNDRGIFRLKKAKVELGVARNELRSLKNTSDNVLSDGSVVYLHLM